MDINIGSVVYCTKIYDKMNVTVDVLQDGYEINLFSVT